MKPLVLALFALAPLCGKAQTLQRGFTNGYYVLADEPTVRHTGEMRIEPFGPSLRVKQDGKLMNQAYKPAQVLYCGTGKTKYVVAKDFLSARTHIDADFAEQLDSGQVVLLWHSRASGGGGGVGTYLVRRSTDTNFTALPLYRNEYKEKLPSLIASRPDLVERLQRKDFKYDNLYALIHAFNTGQPALLLK
jgi:hypothetical protein